MSSFIKVVNLTIAAHTICAIFVALFMSLCRTAIARSPAPARMSTGKSKETQHRVHQNNPMKGRQCRPLRTVGSDAKGEFGFLTSN